LRDQCRHNLSRPQPKVESVLARVLAIDPAPHLELLPRRQGRLPPRMSPRLEGGLATPPLGRQPLVDRRATQPVAADDAAGRLAFLHAPDRQATDGLRGLV